MKIIINGKQIFKVVCILALLSTVLLACEPSESKSPLQNNQEPTEIVSLSEKDTVLNERAFANEYTKFIEEIMAEDGIPGTAVAIVEGNEIIFAKGFGLRDVENNLPVTTETLFHIGSTNKSMTAMLIAALVDEGLFDWDTPVVEIYPDFELSSAEATEEVTMRHLLSMQSGIPDEAEDDFDIDYATAEDTFDFVAETPLLGMPGEEFSYSNLSASLAGYLGVLASEAEYDNLYDGYDQLLREQVLNPIGMETAVIRVSDAQDNPNYGKSYVLDNDGSPIEAEPDDFDEDPLAPSGALKANVVEMALYISTQLNRGQAPNGTRVVSEKNLTETWKPELENYGMGWETSEYQNVQIISHEGSFDNYLSIIGFLPDNNIGFVILTNSEEAGERLIAEAPTFLIDLLLENE